MKRAERFELIRTPESDNATVSLQAILTERRRLQGKRGEVSKSEAIRWAIMFAEKALTEQINLADLDD